LKEKPSVHKPVVLVFVDCVKDLKELCSDEAVVSIDNQYNIILPTVMFDMHVHISHDSHMLQIVHNFDFVLESHVGIPEVFINLVGGAVG
jgi:hypothetical protein